MPALVQATAQRPRNAAEGLRSRQAPPAKWGQVGQQRPCPHMDEVAGEVGSFEPPQRTTLCRVTPIAHQKCCRSLTELGMRNVMPAHQPKSAGDRRFRISP